MANTTSEAKHPCVARDRVIGALERRGLIAATPDWTLTDAGRAAIARATGEQQ